MAIDPDEWNAYVVQFRLRVNRILDHLAPAPNTDRRTADGKRWRMWLGDAEQGLLEGFGEITAGALAEQFSRVLRLWLNQEEMYQVVMRNRRVDEGICHSHDFCDSNMAMHEAFVNLYGREPDIGGATVQSRGEILMWNTAWQLAKEREFKAIEDSETRVMFRDLGHWAVLLLDDLGDVSPQSHRRASWNTVVEEISKRYGVKAAWGRR